MSIGIDLSRWNDVIDYDKVAKQVDFVLLRSGYSITRDVKLNEFASEFKARGINVFGVYHFSYARTRQEARTEAEHAIKYLEAAGLGKDTIVFFDYEYDSVKYAKKMGYNPTRVDCTAFTKAFCDRIEELGYTPGVYLNVDFMNNWYEPGFLDSYRIWLADWRDGYVHDDVLIHQYSSKGKIDGIEGPVDLDRLYDVKMEEKPKPFDAITELAKQVIDGKWGNGQARKDNLISAIQTRVNELLRGDK